MKLALRALRRDKVAVGALAVLVLVTLAAILAPLISPYDPLAGDPRMRLLPPFTDGHLLGLDGQGRDILSRLIWGGRYSLSVAVVPVFCAGAMSLAIGMVGGYLGGRWGDGVMRLLDVVFAFPIVLFAIALAAVLGAGLGNTMVAVAITLVPYMSRVVYTATVQESAKEYVEAARAAGASHLEILRIQLLPNVLSPLVVYGTTLAGLVIVLAAGLSFLGVGITPPAPDWGVMTSDGRQVLLEGYAHVATVPGLVILVVALAFNLLGDGIRDALDPHKQTA
ncbi:ABC transporter permease [Pseudonocardia sp. DSM 110487]|uniref:ABC transporter permease n=1 Tax=Pseudonocardia sp. DSM 110487 TaxID=2865833 RepID=UPI001C69C6B4|nr:ABC transporter permease [Pseudonocardia sp. DSM 110487]QYN37483.1 ABC transporter permease [Pseudonocardia sp. DSM 110487]